MSCDFERLIEAGLDIGKGTGFTGGEEKYAAALKRYIKNYEKNSRKAEEFFKEKDYENYMITVHSLKSNSRMIGAETLGAGFEELEHAARAGNTGLIEEKHASVMSAYSDLAGKLMDITGTDPDEETGVLSQGEAKDIAEKLLEALDSFDDELSKELVRKLSGYPFGEDEKELLSGASGLIDDFIYDDAAELIKKLLPVL